jgi:hypothetical protein
MTQSVRYFFGNEKKENANNGSLPVLQTIQKK